MTPRSRRLLALSALLALGIEAITCILRFGLKLQSTRDTASMARFTLGLRIHHGYVGVLLLVMGLCWKKNCVRELLLLIGAALLLSDFIHHIFVLWPATGSPEFDIWYR